MNANGAVVRTAYVRAEFTGFDGDSVFALTDGTYWLQNEYKYCYYYAYRPQVEIVRAGAQFQIRIVGRTESVAVRQIGVIESQISGAFRGWQGASEYELTNGQVWKQARHRYEYQYKYRPHVLIYDSNSGTVLDAEGCRAFVKRVR